MTSLRTATAKIMAVLLIYLPVRFTVYFVAQKLNLPHTNLIELISEIFIVVAGLYLIFVNYALAWSKLRHPRKWPLLIKLSIILAAWGLVTLSYTPAGFGQAIRGLRLDFLGLGILVLLWLFPPKSDEVEPLYNIALWVCIAVAVIGFIELLFGPGFLHFLGFAPYQFFAGKIRQVHSILPSPNMFGSAMVLLTALIYRRSKSPQMWLTFFLGLMAGSSYSRSAWLAMAVLGASIFFYKLKSGRFDWSVGLLALGLAIGVLFGIYRYHGTFRSAATHDASTQQHQRAFSAVSHSLTKIDQTWLVGTGIGTAGPATIDSKQPGQIAESWYIQLFEEVGMVGLVLFLAIIVLVFRNLLAIEEPILAFLTASLSINALFLHIWADNRFVHILFWSLVGIALYGKSKPKVSPR